MDTVIIPCRVKIKWSYADREGVYIDPPSEPSAWMVDGLFDPFMWEDGNYSCDCNRSRFFGLGKFTCGETIQIINIEPVEDRSWIR